MSTDRRYKRRIKRELSKLANERADLYVKHQRISKIYNQHFDRVNKRNARKASGAWRILRWLKRESRPKG